jgi:hypothetical protein
MRFDLSSLDTRTRAIAGVDMPILHPRTGAPMMREDKAPVTIKLLGPQSDVSRAIRREISQRRIDMEGRGITYTDDDFMRDRQDILVACTVDWTIEDLDGQPFPFSPENARKLWADNRWLWLSTAAFNFCTFLRAQRRDCSPAFR